MAELLRGSDAVKGGHYSVSADEDAFEALRRGPKWVTRRNLRTGVVQRHYRQGFDTLVLKCAERGCGGEGDFVDYLGSAGDERIPCPSCGYGERRRDG
jgi:hypothetical protein